MSFIIACLALIGVGMAYYYFYKDSANLKAYGTNAEPMRISFYISVALAVISLIVLNKDVGMISMMHSTFTAGLWFQRKVSTP